MFLFFRLPVESLALKMLSGGILGFLLGLIPHSQAKKRQADTLAIGALLACSIGGAALGVFLSLPLCIGLTWYIRRRNVTS
jgi:hypothetical protein